MATPPSDAEERRWTLIRDIAVFVTKAALEAARDLVLIPVSVAAGLGGLLLDPRHPERYFRATMELGRRFDTWLDLFGGAHEGDPSLGSRKKPLPNVDQAFHQLEHLLTDQVSRGGMTAQAKRQVDRALDAVHRTVGSSPRARRSAARGSSSEEEETS